MDTARHLKESYSCRRRFAEETTGVRVAGQSPQASRRQQLQRQIWRRWPTPRLVIITTRLPATTPGQRNHRLGCSRWRRRLCGCRCPLSNQLHPRFVRFTRDQSDILLRHSQHHLEQLSSLDLHRDISSRKGEQHGGKMRTQHFFKLSRLVRHRYAAPRAIHLAQHLCQSPQTELSRQKSVILCNQRRIGDESQVLTNLMERGISGEHRPPNPMLPPRRSARRVTSALDWASSTPRISRRLNVCARRSSSNSRPLR